VRLLDDNAVGKLADAHGRLAVLALDHGTPLVDMLDALGRDSGPDAQRAVKRDIADTVGRDASAVLLDPDVSVEHIVDTGALGDGVGLIVRIEADGHDMAGGLRRSQMIDGLGAAGALARHADAAKVMVFVRPDREDLDGHAARLTRAALADCRAHGLPCVIEAMTYRLDDESEAAFAARRGDLIREAAVLFEACGAELLKLEYPGSVAACAAVTAAVDVPWAVLSAGVGHDEFRGQLAAALEGGASGFIAGRSLWKESVALDGAERRAFLDDVVRRRFAELVALLDAAAA
jgi:tagatose 1,6-diphosphate aldolase